MIKFYIHKAVIKKIKREKSLFNELNEYLHNYKNMLVENDIQIKYIIDPLYEGKILYRNRIIFDVADDLESLIIWNIGDYSDMKVVSLLESEYHHNNLVEVIEGNQFLEKEIEDDYGRIQRCLKDIINSKSIEFDYYLDSNQRDIIEKFIDDKENVQAISGAAGSGKTLVLHRLAYEEIIRNKKFIYIVFTKTLKDKFNDFIYDLMEAKNNNIEIKDKANVYTYEEFLRTYLSPILGIEENKYITFDECEYLIERIIKNNFSKLKDNAFLGMHNNEIVRMIMSLLVDIQLDDSDEAIDTIVREKLIKLISRKEINLSDKNIDNIISIVIEYRIEVKKLRNKLLWGDYLRDISEALEYNKNYSNYDAVLIDEMQDLSQVEYNLIDKFLENQNTNNSKIVLAYDLNQRISLEGSTIRNLKNRVNCDVTNLKYSYRNSYNIKKFANNFIEHIEESEKKLKANVNSNKVKILIERDINYVIEKIKNSFMPESDLNIGILAFGDSYHKYYNDFIDEYGRSRIAGIEYFNEENIKGLEFSNLIILDFMSLLDARETVSDIDFRKWYVGITRASENLMIHFSNEEELKNLNYIIYEKFKNKIIDENFEVDNYINLTKDSENAFDEFTKDLLLSLGGESKAILLNEGKMLLETYENTLNKDILDDGINIFYKLKSFNTLLSLLRAIKVQNNTIYMEIVKVAIMLGDREIVHIYFEKVLKNDRNKLMLFALRNNKEIADYLKDDFNIKFDKDKYIKKLYDNINALKNERNHNSIIKLYDNEELYNEIINYYTGTRNYNYDIDAKKCIGKAYKRLNRNEEAINFFIQENNVEEAIRLCELQGNYMKAYNISIDEFKKVYSKKNIEEIKKIGEKIIDLSLKIKKEDIYLSALKISDKINNYKNHNIYFELYLLTLDIKYNIESIKIYYEKDDFNAVLRCFEKASKEIEKNKDDEVLYMVANSYENLNLNNDAAKIYIAINDYVKAVALLFTDKKYEEIIDIYENKNSDIYDNKYGNMIIESYDNTKNINKAIDVCFKINNMDKAIELYYSNELLKEAIIIYKENQAFDYENKTYKILEKCTSNLKDFKLHAFICHYKTKEFGQAIESYYELEDKISIIKVYEEECKLPIEKETIRKLMFNTDVSNERVEELIIKIIESYETFNEIEKALNLYLAINNKSVANRVVEIYYELKKYKELIEYKNKITADYEVKSYEYIAKAYEELNDYKNAIDMYLKISIDKKYIFEVIRLGEYLDYDSANKLNTALKATGDFNNKEKGIIENRLISYIYGEFNLIKETLKVNDLIENRKRKNYFRLYLDIIENNCKNKGDKVIKDIFDFVIKNNNEKNLIDDECAYKFFIQYYYKFNYLFNSRQYKLSGMVNNVIEKNLKKFAEKNNNTYQEANKLISKNRELIKEANTWFEDTIINLSLCTSIEDYRKSNIKISKIENLIGRLNGNIKKIDNNQLGIWKGLGEFTKLFINYDGFIFSVENNKKYKYEVNKYEKLAKYLKNINDIIQEIEKKYVEVKDILVKIKEANTFTSEIREEIQILCGIKQIIKKKENTRVIEKSNIDDNKVKNNDVKKVESIDSEKVIDLTENNIKKENEEKMEDVNKIIDDAKFEEQIKMAKNAIENNLDDDLIEKITELSKRDLKIIRITLNY